MKTTAKKEKSKQEKSTKKRKGIFDSIFSFFFQPLFETFERSVFFLLSTDFLRLFHFRFPPC